jgi:hypothetical protein
MALPTLAQPYQNTNKHPRKGNGGSEFSNGNKIIWRGTVQGIEFKLSKMKKF